MEQQYSLKAGEFVELSEDSCISIARGALWVTFEGNSLDYMLRPGEEVHLKGRKPVAEALKDTTLVIRAPERLREAS
jgi:hypothetical protein